jgi:hypothetical protein
VSLRSTDTSRPSRPAARRQRPTALSADAPRLPTALPLAFCLLLVGALAGGVVGASAERASTANRELTLYSRPTHAQYINVSDDRSRGEGKNPFGNYSGAAAPAPTNERLYGPEAGDLADYAFALFTGRNDRGSAGSAIFVCHYDLNEIGLCDAAFQMPSGTLIGKGAYSFEASQFTLNIIGGTGAYRGVKGAVGVTALGRAAQLQPVFRTVPMLQAARLVFTLHGPEK